MPPWQDVYGDEARGFAIELFQDGLKAVEVVERMRVKYPSFTRQTLSYWAIHDPDGFGVVYRNSIATVAQKTLAQTFDQFEDIYAKTQEALAGGDGIATDKDGKLDSAHFAGLRLLSEITNNQMKGATMTLARIAKREYGDSIKATHEFENAPLVELVVTKPVADGLAGLEKLQNGGD
jgi:hypothetical protein